MKDQSRKKKWRLLILLILLGWGGNYLFREDDPKTVEVDEAPFTKRIFINRKMASEDRSRIKSSSPQLPAPRITKSGERIYQHEDVDEDHLVTVDEASDEEKSISYLPVGNMDPGPSSLPVAQSNKTSSKGTVGGNNSIHFSNVLTPDNRSGSDEFIGTTPDPKTDNGHIGNHLFCSASVPDGSYSYALSVALNCSTSATIKYCLSEGTCCDPDSPNGFIYSSSSPIIVGQLDAQYCLSYYAINSSNDSSDIFRRRYDISKSLPDLYVETPVSWMQTTEAPISANINSLSFGGNNFSLAQISYLSHDVSPTGDDLKCDELATQMQSYLSPTPVYTLAPFDISHLISSQQLEVPVTPAHLSYGVNYLATYLANLNGSIPTYACSVSQVTLMDFSLFDYAAVTSIDNELTGGFTPFGFYGDPTSLVRAPAGESSFSHPDQKIETSFLSIVY